MLSVTLILGIILLFGTVSCSLKPRIVNGSAVNVEKYPFVASLRIASRLHLCGSTIIAPSWVLTAAHCIKTNLTERMSVQYASSIVRPLGENITGVKRVIVHEDYDRDNIHANDIALLELAHSLIFDNKTIAAVTLPKQNFEIPQSEKGAPGVLIGWGKTSTNGSLQRHLRDVHLKIYSDEECNKRHNGSTTKAQICAGVDDGGKGACYGDSGGPLLYEGSIQLGIASWIRRNAPCAVPSHPATFTKVSHYVDWINKHIS